MIRGKKVDLVAVSLDYLPYYQRWFNDPQVTDMLGNIKFPLSLAREREWIEQQLIPRDNHRPFTILTKSGKPVGNAGFNDIDYRSRCAVIGIAIGEKDLWDKGLGEDAIRTLMKFGFEELGLNKIELEVNSNNGRAIACYRKCGFVIEGRQEEHEFYRGEYIDNLRMGVLKKEWLRAQKKK